MSAYLKTIKNSSGDIIYPQTKTSAVYDNNNVSLQTILNGKAETSSITVSLTANGWSSESQTVTATGVTASNDVIVSPAPASIAIWQDCGIICTAQGANSLTFTCNSEPEDAVSVNVMILK